MAPYVLLLLMLTTGPTEDSLMDLSLEELLSLKITTASMNAESLNEAPGVMVVVTREQMIQRGYRHLGDLLRALPGIDVADGVSSTAYNHVVVRGVFGNNKVVVLEDGMRISSPTGDTLPFDENYPLHHISQVEVVYGPASALYGADAFTAVINLITVDANDSTSDRINLSGGENNEKRVDIFKRFKFGERSSLTLSGHFHETDGPDLRATWPEAFVAGDLTTFDGRVIVPAAEREGFALPRDNQSVNLRFNLGDFTLGLRRSRFDFTTATGTRPNATDFDTIAYWSSSMDNLFGSYSFDVSDQLKSDVELSYARYTVRPESKFANIFVDFNEGYKYAMGNKTALNQVFRWEPGEKHQLIFGYNYERYHAIPKTADLNKPFDEDEAITEQGLTYVGSPLAAKIFEINYEAYGMLAQVQSRWSDQIRTTVGLRYDDSSTYGDTLNPRLSLNYIPNDQTTLEIMYGEAFLAPSPRHRYEHFGTFAFQRDDGLYQSFYFYLPNPNLKPEKMHSLEAQITRQIGRKLFVSLALYQQDVDDLLWFSTSEEPVTDFVPGGYIAFTQTNDNIGQVESQGADLSVIYKSENLEAWAHYSWVDAEITTPDGVQPASYIADSKLKAGLTWQQGRFSLTPTMEYMSPRYGGDTNFETPSYTMGSIHGIWQASKSLSLSLNVENVTDKRYYHPGDGGTGAMDLVPQEPRTGWLSVGWEF